MKKIISIVMAVLMLLSLCSCAKGGEGQTAEKVKIGLICLHDNNSTYDANFIKAFEAACEANGVEACIKTIIAEDATCQEAALDLVDQGCELIIADSYGHQDYIIEAAKACPDVQFVSCTGDRANTENLDNFHNAFASIYQGRYLAGVVAGLKLNEMIADGEITADQAVVGYVGAYPYAEVISGYTSWYLGVKSICPTATMKVVYTNSWYSETDEKEAAYNLIQSGCVLISQHADSMGAPTACEEKGIPNVSYNGSTISACPETFLISSRIDWQPYFDYAIKCILNDEKIDTDWCGTIETGSVVLTDVNDAAVADGTAEKIAEVKEKLISGEIKVFDTSTFTVDGQVLEHYMANVEVDAEYMGDTDVISDGYFHESEYRSAPYFDIIIDGVTILK